MLKAFGKYTEFSSKTEENKINSTVVQESLYNEMPDNNKESKNVISGEDIETSIKEVKKEINIREKITYSTGIYGETGLKVKGDSKGTDLKYYKYGSGPNVFFATFAIRSFLFIFLILLLNHKNLYLFILIYLIHTLY